MRKFIAFFALVFVTTVASAQTQPTPCSAKTKAGHQCTRKAEDGSQLCWQHAKVLLMQDTVTTAATVRVQCTATTKAGTRCKNTSKDGNLCHVHKK